MANLLKNIENGKVERVFLPLSKPYFYNNVSLEHLLFNADFDNRSFTKVLSKSNNFKTSYFGILRAGEINVFCKYGLRGSSHAHPDIMNIEIMLGDKPLSRDLSNSGYGAVLCNEWHRMTASHNTVAVDFKNQTSFDGGEVLKFEENSLHALSRNVYEGVDFIRRIEVTEKSIEDEFEDVSKDNHLYDYFFHCEGILQNELESIPVSFENKLNGYQHIKDARKVITDKDTITLKWKLSDRIVESSIDIKEKELFMAKTYDNPVTASRTTLILRSSKTSDKFKVLWKIVK
jgi:hypothetical protein